MCKSLVLLKVMELMYMLGRLLLMFFFFHLPFWFKCNIDGLTDCSFGISNCGGIFRDHHAFIVLCFSSYHSIKNEIYVECVILTMKVVISKGWSNNWIECDSQFVKNFRIIVLMLRKIFVEHMAELFCEYQEYVYSFYIFCLRW